jgi:hypothetical protein
MNIEIQYHNFHYAAAGESSLWNLEALTELCDFTTEIYTKHLHILEEKGRSGSTVTDMTLLWLWWVAHKKDSQHGFETGRPFMPMHYPIGSKESKEFQDKADNAFEFAARLDLPSVNKSLNLCNGLDILNRTGFF